MKIYSLYLILCVFTFGTAKADNSISKWTKNYKSLVKLLQQTKTVGDCTISLSEDPTSKDAWNVNILTSNGGIQGFGIASPQATRGATQVDPVSNTVVRYRQTDIIGWNNMMIKTSSESSKKSVLGIYLNKTLPNGTIYSSGIKCGSSAQPY